MEEKKNQQPEPSNPKLWGNYFKEFLMLFLAVFLGFWVENQRQDREDRQTEKTFMTSLLAELAEDSLKLVEGIRQNQMKQKGFDSLILAIEQPLPLTDSSLHLSYYLQRRYTGSNQSVRLSERTMKQLHSTGGFRHIQNQAALGHYQEYLNRLNDQGHVMVFVYQIKAREMSSRLFDAACVHGLTRETSRQLLDPNRKLKPLDGSTREVNEYANWLTSSNGAFYYYGLQMEDMLVRVGHLMSAIEKEYQLPHPKATYANTLKANKI